MKCVILAAGEGKRMHPLTYTQPKVMLPVANKPLLEWNLLNVKEAGIKEFIFIVGYKDDAVRSYFKDGSRWDIKIDYVNQGKPQGTGHAVSIVEPFVNDFIVICGDTIFGTDDIRKVLEKNRSIGIYQVENPSEYGIVQIEHENLIKIYEKMPQPFTNMINAGIYHFDQTIFKTLKHVNRSIRGEFELTDAINIQTKETPFDTIYINEWRDVVYPWDLLDANTEILQKIISNKNDKIENGAVITGKVQVGKGTTIYPGSYIEGPVNIGENCKIGPNCYIRPYTSIGDYCHVGNACEVKNSIIMHHSNIPHQNYVGDSIIGSNCNLGSGTKVANLRLDKQLISAIIHGERINTQRRKLGVIMGDNVQTGINSMINTGTIIGNDVFIGPGALAKGTITSFSAIM